MMESQYASGRSSAGPGAGIGGSGGPLGLEASISICFGVGIRQLAGLSLMFSNRTYGEQKSSPLRLNFGRGLFHLSGSSDWDFGDLDEPVILGRFGDIPRDFE